MLLNCHQVMAQFNTVGRNYQRKEIKNATTAVESDESCDSISEVIFARNQFSVTTNGMYDNAPTDDPGCLEALDLVMQGYDISQGATYFESYKSYDSWHYKNLNFLFEHGDHWFYN